MHNKTNNKTNHHKTNPNKTNLQNMASIFFNHFLGPSLCSPDSTANFSWIHLSGRFLNLLSQFRHCLWSRVSVNQGLKTTPQVMITAADIWRVGGPMQHMCVPKIKVSMLFWFPADDGSKLRGQILENLGNCVNRRFVLLECKASVLQSGHSDTLLCC